MRSEVTSLSNWAKDRSTLSVSRPIEVVVLNCWVTETNDTPCASETGPALLAPLSAYNDFAAPFSCQVFTPEKLFWHQGIPFALDDGCGLGQDSLSAEQDA